MKSSTCFIPLLAALVAAQPHKQHGHRHALRHNEPRAEPVIEWVTEIEYTTEIIPVTTTIWVSEGFVPPASTTSSPEHMNTVPAQFFEPSPSSPTTTLVTSSSSSSSVFVAPPEPTTTQAPPETTAAPSVQEQPKSDPEPAPVVVPSSSKAPEPVYTPPPVQTTPSVAPVAAPVSSAPSSDSGSSGSGSSGGPCSSGSACSGDITHYEAGLGACGWTSDGSTENVVALSHVLMGTQSNGNPFCGKTITVKYKGKSITAKVVDKCMGCAIHNIDLSDAAFKQLEDMSVGRTQVEWYFN